MLDQTFHLINSLTVILSFSIAAFFSLVNFSRCWIRIHEIILPSLPEHCLFAAKSSIFILNSYKKTEMPSIGIAYTLSILTTSDILEDIKSSAANRIITSWTLDVVCGLLIQDMIQV